MYIGYIYKITCIVNNKIYVGKSSNIMNRFKRHIRESFNKNNIHYNQVIHCAIRKYGKDNFIVEELDRASSKDELDLKERYWIDKLNSRDKSIGYNVAFGGDGGFMGTDQSGNKNPAYNKHWYTNDIDNILAYECPGGWWPGQSKKSREDRSNVLKGKSRTDKQKENYRKSKLGDLNPMKNKYGNEHPNFGKRKYTNGTESGLYTPGTEPFGWYIKNK